MVRHGAGRIVGQRLSARLGFALAGALLVALALAWRLALPADLADVGLLRETLPRIAERPWAPAAATAGFVLLSLLMVPVTVLIAAMAAVFGPWLGACYASLGYLLGAVVAFSLAARLGRDRLSGLLGARLEAARGRIIDQGLLAVATIRVVPLAPFMATNLVAGASGIRLGDFVLGTALGMLPGICVMSAFGFQAFELVARPNGRHLALLAAAALAWAAASFALQAWVLRRRKART